MKLSILIPCYNELNTINELIKKVITVDIGMEKELIVVDDFSTDGTRDFLKNFKNKDVKIIFHDKNMGKGASVRTALASASGDLFIIQDADLELDPNDYPRLLAPILNGKAKIVFGSRFSKNPYGNRITSYKHYLINTMLTTMSNLCTDLNISDMESCYKVFTKEIKDQLIITENRFSFDPEITARLARFKCHKYEVPISYEPRSYMEGKKLSWVDGFRQLYVILKLKFI